MTRKMVVPIAFLLGVVVSTALAQDPPQPVPVPEPAPVCPPCPPCPTVAPPAPDPDIIQKAFDAIRAAEEAEKKQMQQQQVPPL